MDFFESRTAANSFDGTGFEYDRELRLAHLGELAGTIIHEVSQPLGAVISSADAALRWLDRETPDIACAVRSIQRIRVTVGRCGRTIAELRQLSANILTDLTEQSLNAIVGEALALSEPQIALAEIATNISFDPDRPVTKANRDLLLQVMLNIIQNAIDSLLDVTDRQRTLSIRTFTSSNSVVLEIEDNGVGLPDGPTDIFAPLYTTKKDGMGLGLALCRRVMVAHGGAIQVRRNSDLGATMVVTLPRVEP